MGCARFFSLRLCGFLLVGLAGSLMSLSLQGEPAAGLLRSGAGTTADAQADMKAQLDTLAEALKAARTAGDAKTEAKVLNQIGKVYYGISDYRTALHYMNQALTIYRQIGARGSEAFTLNRIGVQYVSLGEMQKAAEYYEQALPIFREVGDRKGEGGVLNNMGTVYSALGEMQKALEFYGEALPISREAGDQVGEAEALANMGMAESDLGEKEKALGLYNQALSILRKQGDQAGEADALNAIGAIYDDLGEQQKALDQYKLALPIFRQLGNRNGEGATLTFVGEAFLATGEEQKALENFTLALPILHEVGDRSNEAITLNAMCAVYGDLGEQRKSLDCLKQALPMVHQLGEKSSEAATLTNLGKAYFAAGDKWNALKALNQALALASAVDEPLLEALISGDLMKVNRAEQPALGIFYGKQAVNLLQRVRGNIQGLDKETQRDFLVSKDGYYHDLTDLLIAQGRLPEAQQVLGLLKEQEYQDYVRGEAANMLSPLTLTPAETQAEEDYQKSSAQIVAMGAQWAALKKIETRTAEQEKQLQQLSDQLDAASKGLNDYYDRLFVLMGKNSEANKQVADVKGDVSALEDQIADTPRTVALYTIVSGDHYRVIVITATATVAREFPIAEKDLNKKIADFEEVLRNPATDPKPLAQELYKILIGPVKADLDAAGAETLVWSLDGALRYVPMASLYDGKQYLAEDYNTVTITPASIAHLGEKPDVGGLSAAAMGISLKFENGLPPLPAVVGELNEIVKDANVTGANGALPGMILLDGQFTEKGMENALGGGHTVVHIASHFVFKPGDDSQSYLLLAGKDLGGGGFHLTVADFRDNKSLAMRHIELLTLSACETGMSGTASNGREVDGLGTTAQLKGAKAVISSLWEVDDASTGELMGDFYRRWVEGGGKVTKVEALRQAQLDLLSGKVKPVAGQSGRGFALDEPPDETPVGYAHPFYWAPFVLMGNWR